MTGTEPQASGIGRDLSANGLYLTPAEDQEYYHTKFTPIYG